MASGRRWGAVSPSTTGGSQGPGQFGWGPGSSPGCAGRTRTDASWVMNPRDLPLVYRAADGYCAA